MSPTISVPPTPSPTVSRSPSLSPTSAPSVTPTSQPSAKPSSSPTYVDNLQASFVVEFEEFDNQFGKFETDAFEIATAKWVSSYPIMNGFIDHVRVAVYDQVVKTKPQTGSQSQNIDKFLQVFFYLNVEYTGGNAVFDLKDTFEKQFTNKNSNWVRTLADEDTAFQALVPASFNTVRDGDGKAGGQSNSDQTTMTKRGFSGIVIVSFLALVLALVASLYAIRSHNLTTFGTELKSPSRDEFNIGANQRPPFFGRDVEAKLTATESEDSSKHQSVRRNPSNSGHQQQTQTNFHKQSVPTALTERGVPKDQVHRMSYNVPPPSPPPPPPHPPSVSEQTQKSPKIKDPIAKRVSELPEPPEFSEVNFGRESSLFDRVRTSEANVFR